MVFATHGYVAGEIRCTMMMFVSNILNLIDEGNISACVKVEGDYLSRKKISVN